MKFMKKAFLFAVGTVAVAYEETAKVIDTQRKKIEKAVRREYKEIKAA